jgi:hypothetical protein
MGTICGKSVAVQRNVAITSESSREAARCSGCMITRESRETLKSGPKRLLRVRKSLKRGLERLLRGKGGCWEERHDGGRMVGRRGRRAFM